MKTLFNILLIAGLSYLAHLFIPIWWIFAIVAFLISFAFADNAWKAFLAGFLGISLLWLILTGMNSFNNDFVLTNKITEMLKLPQSSLLIILTALIGGLVGGFSSMTGYFLKTFND